MDSGLTTREILFNVLFHHGCTISNSEEVVFFGHDTFNVTSSLHKEGWKISTVVQKPLSKDIQLAHPEIKWLQCDVWSKLPLEAYSVDLNVDLHVFERLIIRSRAYAQNFIQNMQGSLKILGAFICCLHSKKQEILEPLLRSFRESYELSVTELSTGGCILFAQKVLSQVYLPVKLPQSFQEEPWLKQLNKDRISRLHVKAVGLFDWSPSNLPPWRQPCGLHYRGQIYKWNEGVTTQQMVKDISECKRKGKQLDQDSLSLELAVKLPEFTVEGVKDIHKRLEPPVKLGAPGQLRREEVTTDNMGYLYPPPAFVPTLLPTILDRFNHSLKEVAAMSPICKTLKLEQLFKTVATFVARFLHLHPFGKGNARVVYVISAAALHHQLGYYLYPADEELVRPCKLAALEEATKSTNATPEDLCAFWIESAWTESRSQEADCLGRLGQDVDHRHK